MTDPADTTHRCTMCHGDKPRDQFYRHPRAKSGIQSRCKPCGLIADAMEVRLRRLPAPVEVDIDRDGRTCALCAVHRPKGDYRYNSRSVDGHYHVCEPCITAFTTRPRITPETDADGLRRCTGCATAKPLAEFYTRADRPDRHRSRCTACHNRTPKRRDSGHHKDDNGRECSRCGVYKPWDEYHRRGDGKSDDRRSACTVCTAAARPARPRTQGRVA